MTIFDVNISEHILRNEQEHFRLHAIHFSVSEHQFISFVGPSGCGKTSLLHFLLGLNKSTKNAVVFKGKDILSYSNPLLFQSIAYVPVDNQHIPLLTVKENLQMFSSSDKEIESILTSLQLTSILEKKITDCSKGEQQRVAIARAILSNKEILILDEPTSNLDKETAEIVFTFLQLAAASRTIIIATHEKQFAELYSDTIFYLAEGTLSARKEKNRTPKLAEPLIPQRFSYRIILQTFKKRFFHKKSYFIFQCFLLLFSFIGLFLSTSLETFDQNQTIKNIIEDSPNQVYQITIANREEDQTLKQFKQENNLLQSFSVQLLTDFALDAIFENQFTVDYTGKSLSDYTLPPTTNPNEICYPILLNQRWLDQYHLENPTQPVWQKQQLCPVRLPSSGYTQKSVLFYYVDSFTLPKEKDFSNDYFPAILPFEAYETSLSIQGIYEMNIPLTFEQVLKQFNDYCDITNQADKKVNTISNAISNYVIKKEFFDVPFYTKETLPAQGGYVYEGRFPEKENEIMIYNKSFFSLLKSTNYYEHYQQIEPFQEKSDLLSAMPSFSGIEIVGSYTYVFTPTTPTGIFLQKSTILASSVYDQLESLILEEEIQPMARKNMFIAFQASMVHHFEDIINGNWMVHTQDFIALDYLMLNISMTANFIKSISFVCFALCLAISIVYLLNYRHRLHFDLSFLYLQGVTKKRVFGLQFCFFLCIFLLPLCFIFLVSPLINTALLQTIGSNIGFLGRVATSFFIPFFVVSACFVAFIFIMTLPTLFLQNKHHIDAVKKG